MADPKAENALREALSTIEDLEARWSAARDYLKIDEHRTRHAALTLEAANPDLWNDQDHAREVTTELGRLNNDLDSFDELRGALDDCLVLVEFSREALSAGDADWTLLDELLATVTSLESKIAALETRSLFSGPYDENDAIVELHAGAGGTDAQDWTEMLLRMYSRWAERRGFGVEIDEATEGQEAGLLSATFIVKGRFAYGWLSAERGVHRLVRISPFDSQARRQTSFASLEVTPLLDDNSAEAHASLGLILGIFDFEWAAAERQYQRAIELSPNSPVPHQRYGELLVNTGRFDAGVAEGRRAVELDPLSQVANLALGIQLNSARRYGEAIAQLQQTLTLGRNFADTSYILFEACANNGMYPEAVEAYARQKQLDGLPATEVIAFKDAFARESWSGFLQFRIRSLEALALPDSDELASFCARAGDLDRAFTWLEKSYAGRSARLTHLKVDARYDNLRADPRFADLLRRVGLAG